MHRKGVHAPGVHVGLLGVVLLLVVVGLAIVCWSRALRGVCTAERHCLAR